MSAQKTEIVIIEGTVARVDHVAGSFVNDAGESIPFDFWEAKILTENTDVNVVRFPTRNTAVALPAKGDMVRFRCDARISGGNVKLTAEYQYPDTFESLVATLAGLESATV